MERFVIGEKNDHKCVFFPDYTDESGQQLSAWIDEDKLGNEHFDVPNFKDSEHHIFWKHQLKEMFDSVMEGNGDAVGDWHPTGMPSVFSRQEVIYFLDRTYGESIKAQFMKMAKRVKFGYLFDFHNGVSMGSGMKYDKNGDAVFMPKEPVQFMYTMEEALSVKKDIVAKVDAAIASYTAWKNSTTKEEREVLWENKTVEAMDWYPVFSHHGIYHDLWSAALYVDEKGVPHDNYRGGKHLKVASVVLPEEGQWLIETTFGNRKHYFDVNYTEVPHRLIDARNDHIRSFETDELAILAQHRVTGELFHVVLNWIDAHRETKWKRIQSKDFQVHASDYFDDSQVHISVTCNGDPIYEKKYHHTGLARHLIDEYLHLPDDQKSSGLDQCCRIVRLQDIPQLCKSVPAKDGEKIKFKPTKKLSNLQDLRQIQI